MLDLTRRDLVVRGSAALAAYAVLHSSQAAQAFPSRPGEVVIPWADQPPPMDDPTVGRQLVWEELDSWITPNDQFFQVTHFGWPVIDAATWSLQIDGLVRQPLTLSLEDVKARVRQEETVTLECSGNHGFPVFTDAVGNARWTETPLASLLEEAGVLAKGIEVVFWGTEQGEVRLEDPVRNVVMMQNFARSMSLADAMSPHNILAYEMNGEPLPERNGYPLRLIAPGWYGIANVKWLSRIEVRDRRFMNQFMARDYVTIREEEHDGETVWTFTSVGRTRLKSAPAKVSRQGETYTIMGAAWGAPIAGVEVRIDDEAWQSATLTEGAGEEYAWSFWTYDWAAPTSGEHTITSRATATDGEVQPAPDDPLLAGKQTYWEANGHITRHISIP